jgi:hypothetical protein
MTTCPWCAEEIGEDVAEVCPHCGSRLSSQDPASPGWAASPAGAAQPPPSSQFPPPPSVATSPTYTHSGGRFVLGFDETQYAIWDRQQPGGPANTFPRTDAGWQDAWRTFSSLEPQALAVGGSAAAAPWGVAASATPSAPKTNSMAVASLVTAILFIPIVPIVLGHVSKREIERSQGAQDGRGLAIAGIVMGWITLGLLILAIIGGVLFFAVFGDEIVGFVREDADARTMLQNAVVEVQDYGRSHGSLAAISPDKLEPSRLDWNTLAYPLDGAVSIKDTGADRVLLVTRTNLGAEYCAGIVGGRVTYGTLNPPTAESCTGGWAFDWQSSQ